MNTTPPNMTEADHAEVDAHFARADLIAMSDPTETERVKWLEGYRFALTHLNDDAVRADRIKFTGKDGATEREVRWAETAERLLAHEPEAPSSYLPEGMDLSDIALFAGSAGELHRREIGGRVFFARMADRLNRARAEALREAAVAANSHHFVGYGAVQWWLRDRADKIATNGAPNA
jgi:hypothetical protein